MDLKKDEKSLEEYVYKYIPILKNMSKSYPESIRDDIVQEGLIGLINAFKSFDSSRDVPFDSYANLCIKNSISSALKKLNVGHIVELDENEICEEVLEDGIIEKTYNKHFFQQLKETLSEKELLILTNYLQNKPISVIAKETNMAAKSVYNSLYRIRNKIKQLYN